MNRVVIQDFLKKHYRLCEKVPWLILNLRFFKRSKRFYQRHPRGFFDKVAWMSFHTDTNLWSRLSDKYEVRKYVAERCGEKYLTRLYGVYEKAAAIDFDALPEKYVIKTNNGCASNIFVHSKEEENREEIREKLSDWLKFPYGAVTGQKHYSRINPKILAEEFLYQKDNPNKALIDYKFYCFNGVPKYCHVVFERQLDNNWRHMVKHDFYDLNWNIVPGAVPKTEHDVIERPTKLEEMIKVAQKLSDGIKFVRVDLYQVNDEVKFGEMTFMPGFDSAFSQSMQVLLGEMIDL